MYTLQGFKKNCFSRQRNPSLQSFNDLRFYKGDKGQKGNIVTKGENGKKASQHLSCEISTQDLQSLLRKVPFPHLAEQHSVLCYPLSNTPVLRAGGSKSYER